MEALERALEGGPEAEPRHARAVRPRRLQALQRRLRAPGGRRAAAAALRRAQRRRRRPRPRVPPRRRRVLPAGRRRHRRRAVPRRRARRSRRAATASTSPPPTASCGCPADADTAEEALHLADRRMYAAKEARPSSAGLQTRTVLLKVLSEREPELHEHSSDVMALARGVARRLGLPVEERDIVARAAELHDIGKMAIPDAILNKPGPLDDREWRFMRRHTIIGEDILNVAPALQPVAALVRASHERWDGKGYPDGTAGDRDSAGCPHRCGLRCVQCDGARASLQAGPERLRGGRGDRALRGHELRPRRGGGVRGRDPLRGGARVRRGLAPALVALACLGVAPATARGAPGDIGVADEGNWFGSSGPRAARRPRRRRRAARRGRAAERPDGRGRRGRRLAAGGRRGRGGRVLDRARRARSTRWSAATGCRIPSGIALAPDGKAYVSDRQRDEVLRLDLATGALSHVADLENATGLAMDKAGKLLVTDGIALRRIDPGTGAITTVATGAPLDDPRDVAVQLDGTLYVAGDAPGRAREPEQRREDRARGGPAAERPARDRHRAGRRSRGRRRPLRRRSGDPRRSRDRSQVGPGQRRRCSACRPGSASSAAPAWIRAAAATAIRTARPRRRLPPTPARPAIPERPADPAPPAGPAGPARPAAHQAGPPSGSPTARSSRSRPA